ncbi:CocE/NonD family hydrolase C-terminal non-catalytic domain-containing protein [Streptomyces sp. P9(2023)]|uniref:CocE/NonD family hydrolase C-terminal non-catalytic domain-containing protein n=1 Tax=Streptomyces sp. P9(2023) TaxID=3064394 RepID=UPI0028F45307|nr:CocE/NonD family hydrolase C-terminal non-catalytic domain-containing protein [Streptomyces sp. P9(2023)]MDT9686882.1 CocE/NonD family hydrolase C-terminal non-catalytic domain-containing protein [Streptomyces sp. P9(2023)]
MPQENSSNPANSFSSFDGSGFGSDSPGITSAEIARLADEGMWAADGSVHPVAARLGQALAHAVGTPGGDALLPGDLGETVRQALALAEPGLPRIVTTEGYRLSAFSLKQRGEGPHPLVVVPAGWTPFGWPLFMWAYLSLARRGYHVLAYTPRGLGFPFLPSTSEGFVDVAGPYDWADGSTVIDHAVDHLAPSAIGFLGESYGSGISQLVAAHDERVNAVVALSTWGNLATSLYDHGTRHVKAVEALLSLTGGPVEEKFDEENRRILADFQADRNMADVVDWGNRRAPESYIEDTNRHGTPTFISNTWHESLFPVNELLTTFNLLEVPKRLNMWIGDHAAPEGGGLIGPVADNTPLREAYDWLDHHLKGEPNGVDTWDRVSNQVMFTYVTVPVLDPETGEPTGENTIVEPARRESVTDWADVTTGTERFALTGAGGQGSDGRLVADGEESGQETGWELGFVAGVDTEATAMDALMKTGKAEYAGNPKVYDTRKIDRAHAAVWTTEPFAEPRRVRGIPTLRLTARSSASSASLFAHLFDVAEDDTARIITHEPFNLYGLTPDQENFVEWELQAAAYDIPAGHRLMLVIDSKDPLYGDASVAWTQTVIGSPEGVPAHLGLPLG